MRESVLECLLAFRLGNVPVVERAENAGSTSALHCRGRKYSRPHRLQRPENQMVRPGIDFEARHVARHLQIGLERILPHRRESLIPAILPCEASFRAVSARCVLGAGGNVIEIDGGLYASATVEKCRIRPSCVQAMKKG